MAQSPESWTAIWTFFVFVATGGLAIIAGWQIIAARVENRKTQTLEACGRYDTDPIIFDCHKKLIVAKNYKKRDDAALVARASELRLEVLTILNFLDAIAIGVQQGLYIKDLARDHISPIVRKHVAEFVEGGVLEAMDCPIESYKALIALDREWQSSPEGVVI